MSSGMPPTMVPVEESWVGSQALLCVKETALTADGAACEGPSVQDAQPRGCWRKSRRQGGANAPRKHSVGYHNQDTRESHCPPRPSSPPSPSSPPRTIC